MTPIVWTLPSVWIIAIGADSSYQSLAGFPEQKSVSWMKEIARNTSNACQWDVDLSVGTLTHIWAGLHDNVETMALQWMQSWSSVFQCSSTTGREIIFEAGAWQLFGYHQKHGNSGSCFEVCKGMNGINAQKKVQWDANVVVFLFRTFHNHFRPPCRQVSRCNDVGHH